MKVREGFVIVRPIQKHIKLVASRDSVGACVLQLSPNEAVKVAA